MPVMLFLNDPIFFLEFRQFFVQSQFLFIIFTHTHTKNSTRARALVQKSRMLQNPLVYHGFFHSKSNLSTTFFDPFQYHQCATDIIPIRSLPPKVKPLKDKRFKFAAGDRWLRFAENPLVNIAKITTLGNSLKWMGHGFQSYETNYQKVVNPIIVG